MINRGQFIAAAGASVIMVHLWATPNATPAAAPLETLEAVSAWAGEITASSSGSTAFSSALDGAVVQNATLSSSVDPWNWLDLIHSARSAARLEGYRPYSEIRLIEDRDVPQIKVAMNAEWANLADKVQSWINLPVDWDGDDGVPPSSAVINAAAAFAHRAGYDGAPRPDLYIASDGEVGFRWAEGDNFASVAFLNDGNVVVYCSQGQGEGPLKLDEPVDAAPDFALLLKGLKRFAIA